MNETGSTSSIELRRRLGRPLPGLAAQRTMAPVGRLPSDYDPTPPGARSAAVLLIVTPDDELIFIRRSQDGREHGGQIAFPGGMAEDHDRDLAETAMRETEEEIGVPRELVTVLGSLSPVYIPVTNFTVWPFVARVETVPPFACQPGEVDEVLRLPIDRFDSARSETRLNRGGSTLLAPTYRFGSDDVWGATAMITAEFLAVLRDAS